MSKVLQNQLAEYGYNLVALPKADIKPLLLLYKNNDAVSSVDSPLVQLFKIADSAPPTVLKDTDVTEIAGSANLTFDATAGVSLLDWLLQKLNMGKLEAKLKLNAKNKVLISYENITEDKVSLLELDNFITGSEPDTARFTTFREKLEENELYVVNAVLKSNAFSITVEDENGQSVDVEATVKGIVNANVDIARNKNNALTLKHAGATPLVFAFKAQQILYDRKKWWEFFRKDEASFRIRDQQGVVLKGESDFPTAPLKGGVTLMDI